MKKLTKEEIKTEADNVIEQFYKGESRASAFGLGFVTGADWAQKQLLQQTDCSMLLELLAEMLSKEKKQFDDFSKDYFERLRHAQNVASITDVMRMIDERQPVA